MKKVLLIGTIVLCFSNLLVAAEPPSKRVCRANDLERKLFPQKEIDRIAEESRRAFAARMAAAGVTFGSNQPAPAAQAAALFDFDRLQEYFDDQFDSASSDSDLGGFLKEQDLPSLPAPSAQDFLAVDSSDLQDTRNKRGHRSECIQPIPPSRLVTFENEHVIATNIEGVEYLECESCDKKFTKKSQYLLHVFRMPVTCKLCQRVFKGKNNDRSNHFKSLCPEAVKRGVSYEILYQSYKDALEKVNGRKKLKN